MSRDVIKCEIGDQLPGENVEHVDPRPSARIAHVLLERLPDDQRRRAVLVVGNGLNLHANKDAEPREPSWAELVGKIARIDGDTSSNGLSNLHLWEHAIRTRVRNESPRRLPHQVEHDFKRRVVEELKEREAATSTTGIYSQVLNAGFADIVTFNFDMRLENEGQRRKLVPGVPRQHEETLHRHFRVATLDGAQVRVWHPHGDIKRATTIKFGIDSYGKHFSVLRNIFDESKRRERLGNTARREDAQLELRRGNGDKALTWASMMLFEPIVFAGFGLAADEWPIWWLLNQRARNFAMRPKETRPATLFLASQGDARAGRDLGAEIEALYFESYSEMWSSLLLTHDDSEAAVIK